MTHGACWCDWAEQPIPDLLQTLDWLRATMLREFGIPSAGIKAAFERIPEYRNGRIDRIMQGKMGSSRHSQQRPDLVKRAR
jgi:hypothetical protein